MAVLATPNSRCSLTVSTSDSNIWRASKFLGEFKAWERLIRAEHSLEPAEQGEISDVLRDLVDRDRCSQVQ